MCQNLVCVDGRVEPEAAPRLAAAPGAGDGAAGAEA